MAELASGAVTSLLGVIRNETRLLGGVRDDVQFIKEEMESMNSFLLHLVRTMPPRGEHDEQVRTWMNQVRLLAQDCNNCIDLYLYRGNPDIHLAKDGLRRYLLWVPWFLRKMVAQHRAAVQLAALKERARDVGERRLRYGVEVPAKAAGQPPPGAGLTAAAPAGDDEDEDGDHQLMVATATHHSGPRGALFGLRVIEDYFYEKLADWMKHANTGRTRSIMPSIAIMVPAAKYAHPIANEAFAMAKTHFKGSVLVDIPAVHFSFEHLEPEDILCYIWRELELQQLAKSQSQQEGTSQGEGEEQHVHWRSKGRRGIRRERWAVIREIRRNILEMKVDGKIEKIKSEIRQVKGDQLQLNSELKKKQVPEKISNEPLGVLLLLLRNSAAAAAADEQDHVRKEAMHKLAECYDHIIKKTASKLKKHMEVEEAAGANHPRPICLDVTQAQYEHILSEVFPKASNSKPLQTQEQDRSAANEARKTTMTTSTTTLGEDRIKEMILRAKQEILQELQEDKSDKKQATGKPDQIPEAVIEVEETTKKTETIQDEILKVVIEDTIEKIKQIQWKIKKLMEYKGIVDKKDHFKHARILIILKTDQNYVLGWEETRNALRLMGCFAGAVIVTTSKNTQRAKEYCCPLREPLDCSLVGLYHDIVLELTGHHMHEDNSQIFRGILDECKPHEFCMKIFAHTLYANPNTSKEELRRLHSTLQEVSPKSLDSIAKKMLKFSYNNLPKEYKSCLLYLAIFPPAHEIRRSTLIGRWVAEGLITTEDWRWSSSVRKAKRCFDALIDRWLVYPADIL